MALLSKSHVEALGRLSIVPGSISLFAASHPWPATKGIYLTNLQGFRVTTSLCWRFELGTQILRRLKDLCLPCTEGAHCWG